MASVNYIDQPRPVGNYLSRRLAGAYVDLSWLLGMLRDCLRDCLEVDYYIFKLNRLPSGMSIRLPISRLADLASAAGIGPSAVLIGWAAKAVFLKPGPLQIWSVAS